MPWLKSLQWHIVRNVYETNACSFLPFWQYNLICLQIVYKLLRERNYLTEIKERPNTVLQQV